MALRLSKIEAYKKRVWTDVSTKASQYYKGRKLKLDLTHVKRVQISWNPLLPKAANARILRRMLNRDKFTMETSTNCEIMDDFHERNEPPIMSFHLRTDENTIVLFDMRKLAWIPMVNHLMLWCDFAKRSNETSIWNENVFDWHCLDVENNIQYSNINSLIGFEELKHRNRKELWKLSFPEIDQPLQPIEFYHENKNRLESVDNQYSYISKFDMKYSLDKYPIWNSNLWVLKHNVQNERNLNLKKKQKNIESGGCPRIMFDFIVYDDQGLIYPNLNDMKNDLEGLKTMIGGSGDVLSVKIGELLGLDVSETES